MFPIRPLAIRAAIAFACAASACQNTETARGTADTDANVATPVTPATYTPSRAETRLRALAQQTAEMIADLPASPDAIPRSVEPDGTLALVGPDDWTSGFFPGVLWQLGAVTADEGLLKAAAAWTGFLAEQTGNTGTHDTGFMIYDSYGEGYNLAGREDYADEIVATADALATRYDPDVGAIKSWDWDGNGMGWTYPVIVDNMMNLELLFAATDITGDSSYYHVADRHAATTLANHFRADNSSYHVVDYDEATGEVRAKQTHQGLADDSAWARGQAWGLYGYTMAYGHTQRPEYLQQARRIAEFWLSHTNLPADGIPYWDFDAPAREDTPRDVSAATVVASALQELALYAPAEADRYEDYVAKVLTTLEREDYRATTPPFLLDHSTGNHPADSEVDVPINYGDYYYVEALRRRATGAL